MSGGPRREVGFDAMSEEEVGFEGGKVDDDDEE